MCVCVCVCVCVFVCGLMREGFNAEVVDTSNYHWVPRGYQAGQSEVIVVFLSGNIDIFLLDSTVPCEYFMFFSSLTVAT
jgi:hypothetical protein